MHRTIYSKGVKTVQRWPDEIISKDQHRGDRIDSAQVRAVQKCCHREVSRKIATENYIGIQNKTTTTKKHFWREAAGYLKSVGGPCLAHGRNFGHAWFIIF